MINSTRRRVLAAASTTIAVGIVVAACGSSSPPKAAAGPSATYGGPASQGGVGGPAASGVIAAVDAGEIQVQDPAAGQTTVRFTSQTTFTETKAATRVALKVGSCAVATTATGTSKAATVTISAPHDGQCVTIGRPTNARSVGAPGGFPGGSRPSGAPSGFPGGSRQAVGDLVIGKITALSGDTLTLAAITPGATQTTHPKTLSITPTTKFSVNGAATKAALKVGKCATAQGKTDSTGAVAARSIAVTTATSGRCTLTFGRRLASNGNG